jgi:hypothetical protein
VHPPKFRFLQFPVAVECQFLRPYLLQRFVAQFALCRRLVLILANGSCSSVKIVPVVVGRHSVFEIDTIFSSIKYRRYRHRRYRYVSAQSIHVIHARMLNLYVGPSTVYDFLTCGKQNIDRQLIGKPLIALTSLLQMVHEDSDCHLSWLQIYRGNQESFMIALFAESPASATLQLSTPLI